MSASIREMRQEDARAFLEVHHLAVRGLAAADYPAEVIEAWAPSFECRRRISAGRGEWRPYHRHWLLGRAKKRTEGVLRSPVREPERRWNGDSQGARASRPGSRRNSA